MWMKSRSQGTDILDFLASVGRHTVAKVTHGCPDLPIQEPDCSNMVFVEDTGELEQTFGAGWDKVKAVTRITKADTGKQTVTKTVDGWGNHSCAQGNDSGWGRSSQEEDQDSGWETTIATATESGQGSDERVKDTQAGWGVQKEARAERGSTCTQKDDSGWRISPQKDENSCAWGMTDTEAGWGGQETAIECETSRTQRARGESENAMVGKGSDWDEKQPVAGCEAGWEKDIATEEKNSGWGDSPQKDGQEYMQGVVGSKDGWGVADEMVTDIEAEWGSKRTVAMGTDNGWGSLSGQAPGTGRQNSVKLGSTDLTENMGANERRRGKFGPSGSNTVPLGRQKGATGSNDGWVDEQVVEAREAGWGCEEKEDTRWRRKNVGGWGNEESRGTGGWGDEQVVEAREAEWGCEEKEDNGWRRKTVGGWGNEESRGNTCGWGNEESRGNTRGWGNQESQGNASAWGNEDTRGNASGWDSHEGKVGAGHESAGGWVRSHANAGGRGSKGNVREGNGGWGCGKKVDNPGGHGSKWGNEGDVEIDEANERRSGTFGPSGSNMLPLGKRKTIESRENGWGSDNKEEGRNTEGWGPKPKMSSGDGWGNEEKVTSEGGWGSKQAVAVSTDDGWDCTESSIDLAANAEGRATKTSGSMTGSDMMQIGQRDAAINGCVSSMDAEIGKNDRCRQSEDQTGWVSCERSTHSDDGSGWTSTVLDEGRSHEQDGQGGPGSYGGWIPTENDASQTSKTMDGDGWHSKPVGGRALAGWGSKAPPVHSCQGNRQRFVRENTRTIRGGTNPRDPSRDGRKFGFHNDSRAIFSPNTPTSQGRRPRLKALLSLPEYSELNELVKGSNKILHGSGYEPGNKLLAEDDKFVLEKILVHHPEKEAKFGCGVDHLIVDSHPDHQVRCFWVVRKDGSKTDFSYWKCLETLFEREYMHLGTKEAPAGVAWNEGTTSAAPMETKPPQTDDDGW